MQSHYVAAVNEEALPGTVVVRLATTDADRPTSASASAVDEPALQYFIVAGDARSQFGVRDGELYVERPLDREDVASYNLQVPSNVL